MFKDDFKFRYKGIPFATYKAESYYNNAVVLSHEHAEIEIITIVSGEADFYIGGNTCKGEKGDVIIIPPYNLHKIFIHNTAHTVYNCVCFDLKIINDESITKGFLTQMLNVPFLIKENLSFASKLYSYQVNAFNAYEGQKKGWELEVIGNLSLFFATLKSNDCFVKAEHIKNEKDFSKSVIEYLNDNFKEHITSQTVSKYLFMSNSYFCRKFKKTFGDTFSNYLNAFRLEKAKTLLRHTGKQISQIASECGFDSNSYFGKIFKIFYGITPLNYRKKVGS
ncbi:MAG: AraC family transcriptional regulator [Clostridia bacterium]|nr:AraC family transcriptional regulator [Clostridia bacterium]